MSFVITPIKIILFGLFCFLLYRCGLYFLHQDYFTVLNHFELRQSILKGTQFDSATVMLFCAPMLVVLSFPFNFIQNTIIKPLLVWLCGLSIFIMLIYSLGDIVYFGEVKRHIGAEVLNLSADKGALFEIALTSRLNYTLGGMLFLLILLFIWYKAIILPLKKPAILSSAWWIKLISWLGLALLYFILFRGLILTSRPINLSDAFTGSKLQQAALALNPVYTSYREIKNRLNKNPLKYVSAQQLNTFMQQSPDIFKWHSTSNKPSYKNVVLILLESWSYKYIDGLSGNNYQVTPFMDSLVSRAQVWDNYYAAGQRSIIGIQAILSSIPALPNQPTLGFGLELNEMSKIADIAHQHNYRTLMMQSSARRSFHMDSIANALGFQEYYGKEDVPLLKTYPQEQPRFGWDYDALQFFNQKLSQPGEKQPFFAFMFTGTTHEPFPTIGKEFERYPHSNENENGFLNTLKYSDWALEQFMLEAQKQPWYQNTIFIFTADHTLDAKSDEALPEKYHIPLLIFTPDGTLPPTRHQQLASQYDIFPTIMDLLGFNQTIYTFGQSLYAPKSVNSVMLNNGDVMGMVLPNQNWAAFTEKQVGESVTPLTPTEQAELHHLQLKMQYADYLLRTNRWTLPARSD